MPDSDHCRLHEQITSLSRDLATVQAELKAAAMALALARRETLWMIMAALAAGALVERIFK